MSPAAELVIAGDDADPADVTVDDAVGGVTPVSDGGPGVCGRGVPVGSTRPRSRRGRPAGAGGPGGAPGRPFAPVGPVAPDGVGRPHVAGFTLGQVQSAGQVDGVGRLRRLGDRLTGGRPRPTRYQARFRPLSRVICPRSCPTGNSSEHPSAQSGLAMLPQASIQRRWTLPPEQPRRAPRCKRRRTSHRLFAKARRGQGVLVVSSTDVFVEPAAPQGPRHRARERVPRGASRQRSWPSAIDSQESEDLSRSRTVLAAASAAAVGSIPARERSTSTTNSEPL